MDALTVRPGIAGSLAMTAVAAASLDDGPVVVDGLAVCLCGTDVEIVEGRYGTAPAGDDRLVIGHENLGVVRDAPAGSEWGPASHPTSSSNAPACRRS